MRNEYIQHVDAIAAVNKEAAEYLTQKNDREQLGIGYIAYVPPLFDATPHLQYKPTETREAFFKQHFALSIKPYPIITMVANFYADLLFKNGMATYLEVITAQSNTLQGELELAALKKEQLSAVVELYRALGGGWN